MIRTWRDANRIVDTTEETVMRAIDLVVDHRLAIWDAVILAAAAEAGCRMLLSEDMHAGFSWTGVTIVNPFDPRPHPLLAQLLGE